MNCDPNALLQAAACYRCIPGPIMQRTMISLLCHWANNLTPPVQFRWEPETEIVGWTDSGGLHSADYPTFVATADIPTVSIINAGGGGITAFYNIGSLPSLANFQVTLSFGLTALDVSGCANLTYLDFNNCGVITLTGLADCTLLQTFYCFNNGIAGPIDFTTLTQLQVFDCSANPITSIDCSGLANLTSFSAGFCNLTLINITGCFNITTFWVDENPLLDDNIIGPV